MIVLKLILQVQLHVYIAGRSIVIEHCVCDVDRIVNGMGTVNVFIILSIVWLLTWCKVRISNVWSTEVRYHHLGSFKEDRGRPLVDSHSLVDQVDSTELIIATLSCMYT